ncbi:PAAR domain-containing protein [Acinetobacter sp. 2JN-4]|uniref:PAAR domain-containing protein n=1 Tax=Acinetobacter sp. 2JN-4 TaxID=2479844 RepID=UPI000EF9E489|nr:PAAR domain-containing protein [Acinetobacter sp. 2JN-4]RLZ06635.1 PAAR domain-containing protein [Acinetobacter sp. 2JN-4]
MATPYIVVGCPTTGGGKVITGSSFFLIEGIPIACVGDTATCPKHQTVATIITGDPHMQVMGKMAARVNDSLSCGCKLLPKQNLVVQDNGGGSSSTSSSTSNNTLSNLIPTLTNYSHRFQIIDDFDQTPLGNVLYEVVTPTKRIEGITDKDGYTEIIEDVEASNITINILCDEDHEHEH